MNKKLNGIVGLVVVAAIIGAANLILSSLPLRMDLTGEKLYTCKLNSSHTKTETIPHGSKSIMPATKSQT